MKIIVYTNLSDSATRAEMMELGADDFVLKSAMIPSDLIALVSSAADSSRD
jgi:DNA-binding NarL/FixJ family response regulator